MLFSYPEDSIWLVINSKKIYCFIQFHHFIRNTCFRNFQMKQQNHLQCIMGEFTFFQFIYKVKQDLDSSKANHVAVHGWPIYNFGQSWKSRNAMFYCLLKIVAHILILNWQISNWWSCPPNTTACLQPCDAGMIAAIKASYRKLLLHHFLSQMDECHNATELSKQITLKDAIGWLTLIWATLDPTSIQRCFAKSVFSGVHQHQLMNQHIIMKLTFALHNSWVTFHGKIT